MAKQQTFSNIMIETPSEIIEEKEKETLSPSSMFNEDYLKAKKIKHLFLKLGFRIIFLAIQGKLL